MNPEDELKFGEATKRYVAANAPSEEAVQRRLEENSTSFDTSYIGRMAPSPQQLDRRIELQDSATPLAIQYANDPKELARQQKIQRIDYRSAELQQQLLRDNPEYYYSMVEPDSEYSRLTGFQKIVSQGAFMVEYNHKREQMIEEELGFLEENGIRRLRNLWKFTGRPIGMLLQGSANAILGTAIGGVDEIARNVPALLGDKKQWGDKLYSARYDSDATWFKVLFGNDKERDIYGRVTSETSIPLRSAGSRAMDYYNWAEENFGDGEPTIGADGERKFELGAMAWSIGMTPVMIALDATDFLILPYAGMSVVAKGTLASRRAFVAMGKGIQDVVEGAGVNYTKAISKEANAAIKAAQKADNSLEAQRIINDFMKKVLPEGSDALRGVDDLGNSINIEIAQARTTLDELATSAPDIDTFKEIVTNAIAAERATQLDVLGKNLARITNDPTFVEATQRVNEIFKDFGDAVNEVEVFKGQLKDDTPADIVDEFERLKTELSEIVNNNIVPIENQRVGLGPNVPLGQGPYDLTNHLLQSTGQDLGNLLEEVFTAQRGRITTAIDSVNTNPFSGSGAVVSDASALVQREIATLRTAGRRNTALNRMNQYLIAEDIARGALGRRALLKMADEAALEPVKAAGKKVPKAKAPKKKPVSPVNQKVFDGVKLSMGDTILEAAQEAAKYKTYEEFYKNSNSVVWQGRMPLAFNRSKSLSDEIVGTDVNPGVVIDMKQPLRLDDPDVNIPSEVVMQIWGVKQKPGGPITDEQAAKFLKAAEDHGFDGIVYNGFMSDNVTSVLSRMPVRDSQIIPAAAFFDNIKGGKEIFGEGLTIAARRQNQIDDVLEKALPKDKEVSGLATMMGKNGLPTEVAARAAREIQALYLDKFFRTLNPDAKATKMESAIASDSDMAVQVMIDNQGIRVGFVPVQGEAAKIVQLKSFDESEQMYKSVIKNFQEDAMKRVKDLRDNPVPGSVTEAKFIAKGPGHKAFVRDLNKRVMEGVFLPEEAMLVRRAFLDVDDKLLSSVPMLETSADFLSKARKGSDTFGEFSAKRVRNNGQVFDEKITLARGLAYQRIRRIARDMKKNPLVDSETVSATETFMHEFGHLGHHTLLDDTQKKLITKVWESMDRNQLRTMFARGDVTRRNMSPRLAASEEEFFAQAFAEYTMRNVLVVEEFLPLFERITKQMKGALKTLFTRKSNEASGNIDELIPIFNQILRGQSASKNKSARKAAEEISYSSKRNKLSDSSLNPNPSDMKSRKPLINRRAFEVFRKQLQAGPKGLPIPEDIRQAAIVQSQDIVPPPPKSGLKEGVDAPDEKMLDAKVPSNINKMDPSKPDLADSLDSVKVFGKGVRVPKALRTGQNKLASTMKKVQKDLVRKDKQFVDAVEKLKGQRDAAVSRATRKFKTAEDVKKVIVTQMKAEEAAMDAFGTGFSKAQAKEIARMVGRVKTNKQLTTALNRVADMVDDQLRAEAKKRIGNIITKTEEGTRTIPPFWQEKVEDIIGEGSIRLKLFREDYQKRLDDLAEWLAKPENADEALKFSSVKSLKMLRDLQELQKRAITDFDTDALMKLTYDIERAFEQGEAAQFVIKGGKTKKIVRTRKTVDLATGEITTEKFVTQKGGEFVKGLEQLRIDNQVEYLAEGVKKGEVLNLDKADKVMDSIGDLDAPEYKGVYDSIKGLSNGAKGAWNKGIMTYLTVDRVIELMDKMMPNGRVAKLLTQPLRKAINKGEAAGQDTINRWTMMERMLTKRDNLYNGKNMGRKLTAKEKLIGGKSNFTKANYQRIAIHAYHKQGLDGKMTNLVDQADIDKVVKGGLEKHEEDMYNFMREELDKLWPELDRVMRDEHGTRISKIEHYFPIQNNVLDNRTMSEILNVEYVLNKRKVADNFTKKRYDETNTEMVMDARAIFKKHIKDVNYYVQVESELQRVGKITRDKGFVDTMGKDSAKWFGDYIDTVSRRGTPKNYQFGVWDEIKRNLGAATLGFNLSPILKQPLAAFAGIAILGPQDVAVNGYRLMYQENLYEAIGKNSLEQRLRAADDPAFTDYSLNGKLEKWQEYGYWAIKQTDAHTARGIWLAAYTKSLKKKGLKFNPENFKNQIGVDAEAVEYADTIVRKTQGSGKFQDLPKLFTGKDKKVWTSLLQFQSFVFSQSQLLTHDALYGMYAAKAGKSQFSVMNATGKAALIFPAVGVGLAGEKMISDWLTNWYGSESSKDRLKDQTLAGAFFEGAMGSIPAMGTVYDVIFNVENSQTNVPVLDKIRRGGKAFSDLIIGIADDDKNLNDKEKLAKSAVTFTEALVALGLGVPGTAFAAARIRSNFIEPSFRSPAEQLYYMKEAGDKAGYLRLITQFEQDGLDAREIFEKSEGIWDRQQNVEMKANSKEISKMIMNANTPAKQKEVLEYLQKLQAEGKLTPEMEKEIRSKIKSEGRLRAIGEK